MRCPPPWATAAPVALPPDHPLHTPHARARARQPTLGRSRPFPHPRRPTRKGPRRRGWLCWCACWFTVSTASAARSTISTRRATSRNTTTRSCASLEDSSARPIAPTLFGYAMPAILAIPTFFLPPTHAHLPVVPPLLPSFCLPARRHNLVDWAMFLSLTLYIFQWLNITADLNNNLIPAYRSFLGDFQACCSCVVLPNRKSTPHRPLFGGSVPPHDPVHPASRPHIGPTWPFLFPWPCLCLAEPPEQARSWREPYNVRSAQAL